MAHVPGVNVNQKTDYGELNYDSDSDEDHFHEDDYGDGSDSDLVPEYNLDEDDIAAENELFDVYDSLFADDGTMHELYKVDDPTAMLPENFCPRNEVDKSDSQSSNGAEAAQQGEAVAPTADVFPLQPPSPTPAQASQPEAAAASAASAACAAGEATNFKKVHVFVPSRWTKSSTLVRVDGLPEKDEKGNLLNAAKMREIVQNCLDRTEKPMCRLTYPHEQVRGVAVPHLGWAVIDVPSEEDVQKCCDALNNFAYNGCSLKCMPMPRKELGEIYEDKVAEIAGDYQYLMERRSRIALPAWMTSGVQNVQPSTNKSPDELPGAPKIKHRGIQKAHVACGKALEVLNKVEGWDQKAEEHWTVNTSVVALIDFETAYVGRDYIKPVEVGAVIGTLSDGFEKEKGEFGTLMHPGAIKELHVATAAHVSVYLATCVPYKNCSALRLDYAVVWDEMINFLRPASLIIVKGLDNQVDRHAVKWLCAAACHAAPERVTEIEAQRKEILGKFVDYMAFYRTLEAVHLRNTSTEGKIIAGTPEWAGRTVGLCEWAKNPECFVQRSSKDGVETIMGRDSKNYLVTPDADADLHCCPYHKKFLEMQCEWESRVHCAQRDSVLGMKALLHAIQKDFPTIVPSGVRQYERGQWDFEIGMYRTPWRPQLKPTMDQMDAQEIQNRWSTNVDSHTRTAEDWPDLGPNGWGDLNTTAA